MKIEGKIIQIIPPEKNSSYLLSSHYKIASKGKYLLVVVKEGVPSSRIMRFLRGSKEEDIYDLVLDECDYKKGDHITLDTEPVYIKTEILQRKNA